MLLFCIFVILNTCFWPNYHRSTSLKAEPAQAAQSSWQLPGAQSAAPAPKAAAPAEKQSYFTGVADILTDAFEKAAPTPAVKTIAPDAPIAPRVTMHSPVSDAPAQGLEQAYKAALGEIDGMVPPAFVPTQKSDALLDISPEEAAPIPADTVLQTAQAEDINRPAHDPDEGAQAVDIAVDDAAQTAVDAAMQCPDEAVQATLPAADAAVQPAQTSLYPENEPATLVYLGEAFKTYILAQAGDVICLIDKHAAHERMLYEKLVASYGDVASQMLLEAAAVNLSAAEKQALLENQDLLAKAGLELEDFGGTTVLVRAVPADVAVSNVEDLVVELAAKLASGSRDVRSEKTEWVLSSISCRAAIKAGGKDEAQQLMHLAQKILSGEIPLYCPHGRPCMITLTRKELEKQFGRIV